MAVVSTAPVAYLTPGSYFIAFSSPAVEADFGSIGSFNPWPPTTPPTPPTNYLQRVWDSGTYGWCYYTKLFVDPNPAPGETTPPYTGAISAHSVVLESQ